MPSLERRHDAIDTLDQMVTDLAAKNLGQHSATPDEQGRCVMVDGKRYVNFGSCSYLGLERHPTLVAAAHVALDRFGTQFSSSRAFTSVTLYDRLEGLLGQMFERPVLVTPTTTLGHQAALPTLVRPGDAVVLDMQVHASVQTTAQLLKARGNPVHIIRHNQMGDLERKIDRLRGDHERIWYLADGVYSMRGDLAPMERLHALLERHPSLHLYIDDAHGMSWAGRHGTGYVRSQVPHHERMVLAVSLNKAFACAGGAIVFPDEDSARRMRNCGGPMLFSGPIQPALLGAAIASARLHLSPELVAYQAELQHLIEYTNRRLAQARVPQMAVTDTPIFFVPVGLPRTTGNLVQRLLDDGLYVHMGIFPATLMKQGGVRFVLNRSLSEGDIDALVDSLRRHYLPALQQEGSSPAEVARAFRKPDLEVPLPDDVHALPRRVTAPRSLHVDIYRSIAEVDALEWDALFAGKGSFSHAGLTMLERVCAEATRSEDLWDLSYLVVRDRAGRIVLATCYCVALVKDDMLSPKDVSAKVEAQREQDPYYLSSNAVMLGCPLTKGEHLFLDRAHPGWARALGLLTRHLQEVAERTQASQILLREFCRGADDELKAVMLELGFFELTLPDVAQVRDLGWRDHDEYVQRLSRRRRWDLRREILDTASAFEVVTERPASADELDECFGLYQAVSGRALALNMFGLPRSMFEAMCAHPDYDIIRLYLKDDPRPERRPVAVMFSFVGGGSYCAMIVGLDYDFVRSHGVYKQILYQTVQRAYALGCERLDLAYTAIETKKKVGARPYPTCAYVQSLDHYPHAVLEALGSG